MYLATTATDIRNRLNILCIVQLKTASYYTNRNKQNILHLFRMAVTDISFYKVVVCIYLYIYIKS